MKFGGGQRAAMSKSKRGSAAARIITRLGAVKKRPAAPKPARRKPVRGGY
jgi:hypothetical protein